MVWPFKPCSIWISFFFCFFDKQPEHKPHDIDGTPLSGDEKEDEDLDGIPLDGAALLKSAMMRGIPGAPTMSPGRDNQRGHDNSQDSDYDDDIDGIPCEFWIERFFVFGYDVNKI